MKKIVQTLSVLGVVSVMAFTVWAATAPPTTPVIWTPLVPLNNFNAGEVEATKTHFKLTLNRNDGPYEYAMVLDMQQDGRGAVVIHRYCTGSDVMCTSISGNKDCIESEWAPWCYYNPAE